MSIQHLVDSESLLSIEWWNLEQRYCPLDTGEVNVTIARAAAHFDIDR